MTTERSNFHVPTGGSGSGKSSIVADHRVNVDAYAECGYRLVEIPKAPVTVRAAFVLQHIGAAG